MGEEKYDVMETSLYNSVLAGVSLDGKKFFYTNPLRLSKDFPYTEMQLENQQKISAFFCCPPNTVRTLCEAQNYAYSISQKVFGLTYTVAINLIQN